MPEPATALIEPEPELVSEPEPDVEPEREPSPSAPSLSRSGTRGGERRRPGGDADEDWGYTPMSEWGIDDK